MSRGCVGSAARGCAVMAVMALMIGCGSQQHVDRAGIGDASGAGGAMLGVAGNAAGGTAVGRAGAAAAGASGPAGGSLGAGQGGGRAGAGGIGGGAAAASGGGMAGGGMAASGGIGDQGVSAIRHVFVIAMENHDEGSIIGNSTDASYINAELLVKYASAAGFVDRLPISIVSEPHYVWMEAGTNAFSDHTFSSDDAPSASNSTASTEHLATQLTNKGLSWMAYQEGIDGTSGACPIAGSGYYQPKHDPFVFFRDVSGNPPSKSNADCVAHHEDYGKLADDLKNRAVASYNFITPNLCHDMHGQSGCPSSNTIAAGDDWLRANLPPLIAFCDANDGVIFIVWDEGESSQRIPFLAVGARVKSHYVSSVEYDHSSLVRSLETIFELPVLSTVSAAYDFRDLFQAGKFP
jgi:hypothetical protein